MSSLHQVLVRCACHSFPSYRVVSCTPLAGTRSNPCTSAHWCECLAAWPIRLHTQGRIVDKASFFVVEILSTQLFSVPPQLAGEAWELGWEIIISQAKSQGPALPPVGHTWTVSLSEGVSSSFLSQTSAVRLVRTRCIQWSKCRRGL